MRLFTSSKQIGCGGEGSLIPIRCAIENLNQSNCKGMQVSQSGAWGDHRGCNGTQEGNKLVITRVIRFETTADHNYTITTDMNQQVKFFHSLVFRRLRKTGMLSYPSVSAQVSLIDSD